MALKTNLFNNTENYRLTLCF